MRCPDEWKRSVSDEGGADRFRSQTGEFQIVALLLHVGSKTLPTVTRRPGACFTHQRKFKMHPPNPTVFATGLFS